MASIVQRAAKDGSITWQVKIRRKGYPPVPRSFTRRADAEACARQQEEEIDRGVWRDRTSADTTTLYALLARYLKDVIPNGRGAETETHRVRTLMRDTIALHKLFQPVATFAGRLA